MPAPDTPLVSVVIPCYRGERYLAQAIESCLRQTHTNLEVVVVDDASPDRCAAIAEAHARSDPRIRVIRRVRNGGMAEAFNTGYRQATGTFHTRLAQDDLFEPNAIACFVEYMERHPGIGLVYADCRAFVEGSTDSLQWIATSRPEDLFITETRIGLCLCWRRELWETLGGFDGRWDTAEDYDFCRRAHAITRLGKWEHGSLVRVRLHQAMSTLVHRPKQQIRQAQIDARYARSRGEARAVLARGFCNAGFEYSLRRSFLRSAACFLRALCCQPHHVPAYRGLGSLLLRPFRPQQSAPPDPASLVANLPRTAHRAPGGSSPAQPFSPEP